MIGILCQTVARHPAHHAREGVDALRTTELPQSGVRNVVDSGGVMAERLEAGGQLPFACRARAWTGKQRPRRSHPPPPHNIFLPPPPPFFRSEPAPRPGA